MLLKAMICCVISTCLSVFLSIRGSFHGLVPGMSYVYLTGVGRECTRIIRLTSFELRSVMQTATVSGNHVRWDPRLKSRRSRPTIFDGGSLNPDVEL